MKKLAWIASASLSLAQIQDISGARIRAHVRFLASDLLEGRGVGERGGLLATEYIATQFAVFGLKPGGDNGTYLQKVPLIGIQTQPDARLSFERGDKRLELRWLEDFVGVNRRQKPLEEFSAEVVFVGHGIVAPEFDWNDYAGADVRGKIVLLFTNEPPSTDEKFFAGRALTYYGRWTYKFEEALRQGALGAVIIHTDETAGYGWEVVRNSWGGEEPYVRLAAGESELAFAGWITRQAGAKLLGLAGRSVEELLKAADTRGFRPFPLGVRLRARIGSKIRDLETHNVVGIVPGSDPVLSSEAVVFTAHWDHLGIGTPVGGDAIYNGAVDNATGCGILLELARFWAALEQKPRRSAVFVAVTAEEGGLRGSAYYAAHPAIPAAKTAVALNFDGFYPFGRTKDVVVTGAERTTLWPIVEQAARRMGLEIKPESRPEQGFYYRSDHFSFARAGIPAFSIKMGDEFFGKPEGYGRQLFEEYNAKHYHRPSDEYREDWDFSGIEQMARFGFLIGLDAANLPELPDWLPGSEFRRR
ncbi:MAG: M28 family peptidase [Bryobacterales bacterium]|nr:M28 family peptidase [Bryobacteraceae bacterium]MDW8353015.1 M28 family peptidase [Bryobacterales bacterium]